MKIAQSTLRKVIQEEIEKVREAPTSDMEELHNRAMDQLDGVMNRLENAIRDMSAAEALDAFNTLTKMEKKLTTVGPQGDEDYRMVDPVELTRRAQEEKEANYIDRIMDLDPTQDEDALENMDIDELEARELLLRRRAER
jgi:hypothetical protein